jgi:hypothetical protein
MIDSIVGSKFQLERKKIDVLGNNTDSLVLNDRLGGQVFSIYEDVSTPVYDDASIDFESYYVTRGESPYCLFIHQYDSDGNPAENNRLEHHPTWPTRYSLPLFRYEHDYLVDAEFGWPVVPQDIQDATLLLINDIVCGNNRYANKYIRQWNAGGVAMSFADQVFAGTGNLIVDNILEKYKMEAIRARML